MSGIFDENNMRQSLEKYVPDGETLTAGVHGVGIETEIKQIFGKCELVGDKLIPNESGTAIEVTKCKYSKHDVYMGITQNYLILSECEVNKHFYEFDQDPDLEGAAVEDIETCISITDIGICCFPFTEIEKCVIKKAWMGAFNCSISMKGGSVLKIMLPKRGGLGGGMPHHAEYREAILERLSAVNT